MTWLVVTLGLLLCTMCSAQQYLALMCADDGKFSGMSELYYIQQQLVNATVITDIPFCQSVETGYLPGFNKTYVPVVVATTGIGDVNAALCTMSLLRSSMFQSSIRSIIYTGTSGWSQRLTGFDPTLPNGCKRPTGKAIALGSVCITSSALDQACGLCVHQDDAMPSECQSVNCKMSNATQMFGQCFFKLDPVLARAVYDSSIGLPLPAMPTELVQASSKYWSANGAVSTPTNPVVLDHQHCVESDERSIVASGPHDIRCRHLVSEVLGRPTSRVPCVAAMEGVGLLRAVSDSSFSTQPISVAILRGASNWDTYPLYQSNDGRWKQNVTYVNATSHDRLTLLGYHYAISTANTIILNYVASLPGNKP